MCEILKQITQATSKGQLLEDLVVDILKGIGLINVQKQKSGSQYGYDVSGYKKEGVFTQCWKVECKNLQSEIGINDIAPKLIWHVDNSNIDKFILVSINGISNDVRLLLESNPFSFPVEIWYGDYLEKLICESPAALFRLNISSSSFTYNQLAQPLFFSQSELKFNVVHSSGTPFSYDYFLLNGKAVKAYSEHDFCLTATISNKTNRTFVVQEILIRTIKYLTTDNTRILRQYTQKGLIEPLRLFFNPSVNVNGKVDLIHDKVLEVKSNSTEYIKFKLSPKCKAGYYELLLELTCVDGENVFPLYSSVFSMHKKGAQDDIVSISVLHFYDTPVEGILNTDNKTWRHINSTPKDCLKFLGATLHDTIDDHRHRKTWTVNIVQGKSEKVDKGMALSIRSDTKSTIFADLNIPIEEKIYTCEDFQNFF